MGFLMMIAGILLFIIGATSGNILLAFVLGFCGGYLFVRGIYYDEG